MQQDYKNEMRAMTEGLAEWCRRRERRQRTTHTLIGAAVLAAAISVTAGALIVPLCINIILFSLGCKG